MNRLLTRCDEFVAKKKSSRSHWHPIFGWYSETLERRYCLLRGNRAHPVMHNFKNCSYFIQGTKFHYCGILKIVQ